IEGLERGALSPTTVRLLARHLTAENHGELLAAASGRGKQAVEELLACRFPEADVAGRVRKMPAPAGPTAGAACDVRPTIVHADADAPLTQATQVPARAVVRPLAPE